MEEVIPQSIEFEWDEGNVNKNRLKHAVAQEECEELFFNKPILINEDVKHSLYERRMLALGKTNKDRTLIIAFTIRGKKIRIISARDQNKKERIIYKEQT